MEGIFIGTGPGFQTGAKPENANLLDIAPTVLHLLGVPVPEDMDGRVLTEVLEPSLRHTITGSGTETASETGEAYTEEEDEAIQQRLADLGYM
jgi:arylsulfatase A-like enzyme